METTRQNKIARLIQKELSDIFLLQTKAMHVYWFQSVLCVLARI